METLAHARGRDWHVESRKPRGGFCFIHENSIHAVWSYLRLGELELRDIRVWLACHEMQARRCTLDQSRKPCFTHDELHALIGGTGGEHVRRSLRRLTTLGLLQFDADRINTTPFEVTEDPGRPVPVPRPVLRLLAKSRGRAFIATVLGHLLRCLYYTRGVCRSGGWCKASWVAEVFGVALRAVKDARSRLVGLGLFRMLRADQLRLNRFGSPLVVCLQWAGGSAPRKAFPTTESAPPKKHKELSYRRDDHQKPARAAGPAGARLRAKAPDLNDVTEADLKDPWRLAALFKQARQRGWVTRCHADILAVFTAAAHSLRVATRTAPALFYWTVSGQAWQYASCDDEDVARAQLAMLLHNDPNRWRSQLCP
ncbi:MAG: hypothetical protein CMJ31_08920 [Phycisphaerae bacterium]|nr:hypothetical protein [Phycisphaerae bacterium]